MADDKPVTIEHIHHVLRRIGGWGSVYIPEFTWGGLRIDALVVDTDTRWARGFEIKMTRSDYVRDTKWACYTQFCSSLSIVCPAGLIQKAEVPDPFGLLYVSLEGYGGGETAKWEKKPKRFQRRAGLAWLWTYVGILEKELPRLVFENQRLVKNRRLDCPESIVNERRRIENDVLKVIGGIAVSHAWFPIQDVLKAIHGGD
jgi:hypothetical protein